MVIVGTGDAGILHETPRPSLQGREDGQVSDGRPPYGTSETCPVPALRRWIELTAITRGRDLPAHLSTVYPVGGRNPLPCPVVETEAINTGTVRALSRSAAAAGYDPAVIGGHSLNRGAITTGMDRGVHPTGL